LKKGFNLKNISLAFVLAAAAASPVFAQDNDEAQSGTKNTQLVILEVDTQSAAGSWLENNDFIFYGGVGYPVNLIYDKVNNLYQDPTMPSILAGVDFVIPKRVWGSHFTVGAVLGYTTTHGDKTKHVSDTLDVPWSTSYKVLALGGRLAYHFNVGKKMFDPYISAGAFFLYCLASTDTSEFDKLGLTSPAKPDNAANAVGWVPAISGGFRLFVTSRIGVYIEAGWNNLATVSAGASYKF